MLRWLPAEAWQRMSRRSNPPVGAHLLIALADHFEPAILPGQPGQFADHSEQERRLERWCREIPRLLDRWRDADGFPFRHTYFYPAEQYDQALIERLAAHCKAGWGETEIHLHHGTRSPDTAEHTRSVLVEFRDALAAQGCLAHLDGKGEARYAFVHGNWALANSWRAACGVDEEMQILAETGCYADFTLPSAPHPAQIAKINSLYECALPLDRRAPHRRGIDLKRGRPPRVFPLIVQGPLLLRSSPPRGIWRPRIENSEITSRNPPTVERLQQWCWAGISVRGRPDWLFIKLHCHGMDPRDDEAMLGAGMREFLERLTGEGKKDGAFTAHFVTAREMVNIALAACDGREGNPGDYRNYRLHQDR